MIRRNAERRRAGPATFGVPHPNECPHLTTYPRKIKHLHDDTSGPADIVPARRRRAPGCLRGARYSDS